MGAQPLFRTTHRSMFETTYHANVGIVAQACLAQDGKLFGVILLGCFFPKATVKRHGLGRVRVCQCELLGHAVCFFGPDMHGHDGGWLDVVVGSDWIEPLAHLTIKKWKNTTQMWESLAQSVGR